MAVAVTFKNGNVRVFAEAKRVIQRGGIVVLIDSRGEEICSFDARQIDSVAARADERS